MSADFTLTTSGLALDTSGGPGVTAPSAGLRNMARGSTIGHDHVSHSPAGYMTTAPPIAVLRHVLPPGVASEHVDDPQHLRALATVAECLAD